MVGLGVVHTTNDSWYINGQHHFVITMLGYLYPHEMFHGQNFFLKKKTKQTKKNKTKQDLKRFNRLQLLISSKLRSWNYIVGAKDLYEDACTIHEVYQSMFQALVCLNGQKLLEKYHKTPNVKGHVMGTLLQLPLWLIKGFWPLCNYFLSLDWAIHMGFHDSWICQLYFVGCLNKPRIFYSYIYTNPWKYGWNYDLDTIHKDHCTPRHYS